MYINIYIYIYIHIVYRCGFVAEEEEDVRDNPSPPSASMLVVCASECVSVCIAVSEK